MPTSSYLTKNKCQIFTQKGALVALVALYVTIFLTGILVYRDYGISWDEHDQVRMANSNYDLIVHWEPQGNNISTQYYYGPLFELVLKYLTGQPDPSILYTKRHIFTFIAAFCGLLTFGALILYVTKKHWLAFWGVLFLFLSPRIFADSFYNTKDIPFLAFYLVGCLTQIWFLDSPTLPKAILHGIACAAVIAVRIPALILPVLTLVFLVFSLMLNVQNQRVKLLHYFIPGVIFILVVAGGVILFYPILWASTWLNFKILLQLMGHFAWDGTNFYQGQFITATSIPWHYIPVWVAITTPPLYLLLILIGLGVMATRLVKIRQIRELLQQRNDLLLLSWSFLPWLVVIVMGSMLYNGWRHMYFIYPGLLLVALQGLDYLLNLKTHYPRLKQIVLGLLIIAGLAGPLSFMVRNHPYENLYFNRLAGGSMSEIKQRYDMDYWGLTYRKGLETILAQDSRQHILFTSNSPPGKDNLDILPPEQRQRLEYTSDLQTADYYLGNYLTHPGEYPFPDEIYTIEIGGAKILTVFKLR